LTNSLFDQYFMGLTLYGINRQLRVIINCINPCFIRRNDFYTKELCCKLMTLIDNDSDNDSEYILKIRQIISLRA